MWLLCRSNVKNNKSTHPQASWQKMFTSMKRNDGDGVIPIFLNVFYCFMRKTERRLKYSLKILSSIKYHEFHSNLARARTRKFNFSTESASHRRGRNCTLVAYSHVYYWPTGTSHTSRTTGVMQVNLFI